MHCQGSSVSRSDDEVVFILLSSTCRRGVVDTVTLSLSQGSNQWETRSTPRPPVHLGSHKEQQQLKPNPYSLSCRDFRGKTHNTIRSVVAFVPRRNNDANEKHAAEGIQQPQLSVATVRRRRERMRCTLTHPIGTMLAIVADVPQRETIGDKK